MKLDEQVTSLELSKRLHALGAMQTSLFYWVENKQGDLRVCPERSCGIA
jgi:hypothetical protein